MSRVWQGQFFILIAMNVTPGRLGADAETGSQMTWTLLWWLHGKIDYRNHPYGCGMVWVCLQTAFFYLENDDLVGGFKHFLFSISYMGCHPSHWRSHIFQDGYCTTNQWSTNGFLGYQHHPSPFFQMVPTRQSAAEVYLVPCCPSCSLWRPSEQKFADVDVRWNGDNGW